jgi:hypothetical protein
MDNNVLLYISKTPSDRQDILTAIHNTIVEHDNTVLPVVEPMMGKEMIIYKGNGMMKYGLSSVKNYMSLHVLPIYMNPVLHAKYEPLLNKASFQKGCINFDKAEQMPLQILKDLITDCSKIDLLKIRQEQLAKKKGKKNL